jgi:hypothetical protein
VIQLGLKIRIIANAALGPGISGGDRIFIECAKRWAERGEEVSVCVGNEGLDMCKRNHLDNVEYVVWNDRLLRFAPLVISYIGRTLSGSISVLLTKRNASARTILYSASDFLPDVLPAFLTRMLNADYRWVAAIYLLNPSTLGAKGGTFLNKTQQPR